MPSSHKFPPAHLIIKALFWTLFCDAVPSLRGWKIVKSLSRWPKRKATWFVYTSMDAGDARSLTEASKEIFLYQDGFVSAAGARRSSAVSRSSERRALCHRCRQRRASFTFWK